MKKLILSIGLLSLTAFGQSSIIKAPNDAAGRILYGGLGLPYLIQPSVTNTSYDTSNRTALVTTGVDTGRQYRHMSVYNPDASETIYVCAGDATGCTRDMWFAPPGMGIVDDFGYFGPANNITHIYYRVSGGAGLSPTIRWW